MQDLEAGEAFFAVYLLFIITKICCKKKKYAISHNLLKFTALLCGFCLAGMGIEKLRDLIAWVETEEVCVF